MVNFIRKEDESMKDKIQEHCEKLEDLLDSECKSPRLTSDEFNTINHLLLYLQLENLYKVPEKYFK